MLDAVQELTNLTDELDIVRQVSAKLMKKPSSGAENLVTALQELSKTFDAIDLELKRYLALDFSEPNRPAARKDLVALEGGEIYKRVGDARALWKDWVNLQGGASALVCQREGTHRPGTCRPRGASH